MASLKFSSFGAYVTSWKIGDWEVLYRGSELKRGGIPLLFPNFDVGGQLPYHGFGRVSQWQTISQSDSSCHLRLSDQDISSEFRQLYPYKFLTDLTVKAIDNCLDYCLEVSNLDSKSLPISPGLHPYWPVNHSQKSQIVIPDFKITDWDISPPNNLYNFSNPLTVKFPTYQLTIEDKSNSFHHLQVWSQNTTFPDFNFVCFEPVTRPPNSINNDPILVLPGKPVEFKIKFICDLKT